MEEIFKEVREPTNQLVGISYKLHDNGFIDLV